MEGREGQKREGEKRERGGGGGTHTYTSIKEFCTCTYE